MRNPGTITRAVNAIAAGQLLADADPAVSELYRELRGIAAAHLARGGAGNLQATELVHDAFLKLFRPGQRPWESRAHFFGAAARAMQQLLVDQWRAGRAAGQGSLVDVAAPTPNPAALSDEIEHLAALDPQIAEIVRFRVFAGLTVQQTAEILGLSERTVKRHYAFARTWLYQRLTPPRGPETR